VQYKANLGINMWTWPIRDSSTCMWTMVGKFNWWINAF